MAVRRPVHAGHEEEVDDPADAAKAKGKKPDRSRNRSPVIEAVRARKTKDPKQIADRQAVGIVVTSHRSSKIAGCTFSLHIKVVKVDAGGSSTMSAKLFGRSV